MNPLDGTNFVKSNQAALVQRCTNKERATVYSALQQKMINVHAFDSEQSSAQASYGEKMAGLMTLAWAGAAFVIGGIGSAVLGYHGIAAMCIVPGSLAALGGLIPIVILSVRYNQYKNQYMHHELTEQESRELFVRVENYMAHQLHLTYARRCFSSSYDAYPFENGNYMEIFEGYFEHGEIPTQAIVVEQNIDLQN